MDEKNTNWIKDRIEKFSNIRPPSRIDIVTDTTEFMDIYRGQVLNLDDTYFLITGNIYESRFGMSDVPKYWVKKAIDLETGAQQIVKMVHHEEFQVRVGPLMIRCYRQPEKESQVLKLVCGSQHFMQGRGLLDKKRNMVRVVDFIRGRSLYNHIFLEMKLTHEEYFYSTFPEVLKKLIECFDAVALLHDNDLCHGDIRNDHILIDQETGTYRWIDFDLTQDYSDFDIWSLGNVLLFCAGMGTRTFHEVLQTDKFSDEIKNSLTSDDASAFYEYRIMNLKKLYPYIPDDLNNILLHFTVNTTRFYDSVSQITSDMGQALAGLEGN